jgi:hypothetical protein
LNAGVLVVEGLERINIGLVLVEAVEDMAKRILYQFLLELDTPLLLVLVVLVRRVVRKVVIVGVIVTLLTHLL